MTVVADKRIFFDIHFSLDIVRAFCEHNRVKQGSNSMIGIADEFIP